MLNHRLQWAVASIAHSKSIRKSSLTISKTWKNMRIPAKLQKNNDGISTQKAPATTSCKSKELHQTSMKPPAKHGWNQLKDSRFSLNHHIHRWNLHRIILANKGWYFVLLCTSLTETTSMMVNDGYSNDTPHRWLNLHSHPMVRGFMILNPKHPGLNPHPFCIYSHDILP